MIRHHRRLIGTLSVLAIVFLAAACSSSGFPTSYEDQIDDETGLSNVEMNWLEGCEVGFGEDRADQANSICACSYKRISALDAQGNPVIPFEAFVEVNDRLASDPTSLQDRAAVAGSTEAKIVKIVADCVAES